MFEGDEINGEIFVDTDMATIFSTLSTVQGMLDFEAALAAAQVEAGVIPAGAAAIIRSACQASFFDLAGIGREATLAGNPAIPLIKALTGAVAEIDPEAARWVHFGATSQDVIDSGRAQQFRQAYDIILTRLARIAHALAALTRAHRRTPMIGRSFLQQAVPISFGLKTAGWLDEVRSSHDQFQLRGQAAHQLGGAAGSLASLGDRATDVQNAFGPAIGAIGAALTPSHTQRSRLVRIATELGIMAGVFGKIAGDVALMAQTEIGELAEPDAPGKGGSSAMPHKRNPVLCTLILAAAKRAPGLVSTMLASMPQEHERGLGGWHAEWRTLVELYACVGAAAKHMVALVEGLQVFPDRMRSNLDLTRGLVMSERVSLALAASIGKAQAHHLIEQASRRAVEGGQHLRDVLSAMPDVMAILPLPALEALFDPVTYRGATDRIIDDILALYEEERAYMIDGEPIGDA